MKYLNPPKSGEMTIKGLIVGLLLFITMPVWVVLGIVVAGLLVIWELGKYSQKGLTENDRQIQNQV